MRNSAAWMIPGAVLLLMPKCPMCLAAMISLLFGLGLSTDAATVVHFSVIAFCAGTIVIATLRLITTLRSRSS